MTAIDLSLRFLKDLFPIVIKESAAFLYSGYAYPHVTVAVDKLPSSQAFDLCKIDCVTRKDKDHGVTSFTLGDVKVFLEEKGKEVDLSLVKSTTVNRIPTLTMASTFNLAGDTPDIRSYAAMIRACRLTPEFGNTLMPEGKRLFRAAYLEVLKQGV